MYWLENTCGYAALNSTVTRGSEEASAPAATPARAGTTAAPIWGEVGTTETRSAEPAIDDDWASSYLKAVVELWSDVLDGAGPSGLDRAMELVATIRENRPDREREALESAGDVDGVQLRFFFFALHHLTDAATELLLFRLHGEPSDVRLRVFVSLSLAAEATAGNARRPGALSEHPAAQIGDATWIRRRGGKRIVDVEDQIAAPGEAKSKDPVAIFREHAKSTTMYVKHDR